MTPKSELPYDLDPDELNAMVRDLAREKGLPVGTHPDLIGPDPDYHHYWGTGNEERHKQSVEWRRKLIAELKRRPDWIAEWRAAEELDRRVRELCEAKGLRFRPWELAPWQVRLDDPPPAPSNPWEQGYLATAPMARRLRRELEAELAAESRSESLGAERPRPRGQSRV
jgi:hypothetical protein